MIASVKMMIISQETVKNLEGHKGQQEKEVPSTMSTHSYADVHNVITPEKTCTYHCRKVSEVINSIPPLLCHCINFIGSEEWVCTEEACNFTTSMSLDHTPSNVTIVILSLA